MFKMFPFTLRITALLLIPGEYEWHDFINNQVQYLE